MAISELKLPQGVTAHEYRTPALLADGLANDVAEQLRGAISARGEATLVVSGGRSPVAFFQNLAKQGLDWSKVTITLADERWVPVEHADSNAGLLKQHLLQGPWLRTGPKLRRLRRATGEQLVFNQYAA